MYVMDDGYDMVFLSAAAEKCVEEYGSSRGEMLGCARTIGVGFIPDTLVTTEERLLPLSLELIANLLIR